MSLNRLIRFADRLDCTDPDAEWFAEGVKRYVRREADTLAEALGIPPKKDRTDNATAERNYNLRRAGDLLELPPGSEDNLKTRVAALYQLVKWFRSDRGRKVRESKEPPSPEKYPAAVSYLWHAAQFGKIPMEKQLKRILSGEPDVD